MMYRILARKYRPKQFHEVVEQAHVTTTLQHAIADAKLGHAYLFSGPRGVGKTTVARILVKTLNCRNPSVKGNENCGTCSSCQDIDKGVSLDYQEIDGASHRGIDQIREIQSNLPYASANAGYRIFVIDEAHMLTTEAFNAMLKSLEEPPDKVIFILCTTESGKIPLTIRSRCQHFRFKLVSISHLRDILVRIAGQEGIDGDADAFFYIAKHAAGSIRDAQNLLEQVTAYAGKTLTQEKVLEALGEVSKDILYSFITQLHNDQLPENYRLIEKLMEQGGSFTTFLYELVVLFSAFVYLQEGIRDSELLHMSVDDAKRFHQLSQNFRRDEIYKVLDICFEFTRELKTATEERPLRQLALIKLHRYKQIISNDELSASLKLLAQASDLSEPSMPSATKKEGKPDVKPEASAATQDKPVMPTSQEEQARRDDVPISRGARSTNPPSPPPYGHKINAEKIVTQKVTATTATITSMQHKQQALAQSNQQTPEPWSSKLYRSLMTHAVRQKHSLAPFLSQFRFHHYDEAGSLTLTKETEHQINPKETPSSSSMPSQEAFKEAFISFLHEVHTTKHMPSILPVRDVKIVESELKTSLETITDVFSQARPVPQPNA